MRAMPTMLMALMVGCQAGAGAPQNLAERSDDRAGAYEVVTVLGRAVTRENLKWEPLEPLFEAVIGPILEQYRTQRGIVAADEDIERCAQVVAEWSLEGAPAKLVRQIAVQHVLTWNTSQALYEEFGGAVVFQQFNPLEPVGAQLQLLRRHQRNGSLRFQDARSAERFWKRLSELSSQSVVDPEEVDYSVPWWEEQESG